MGKKKHKFLILCPATKCPSITGHHSLSYDSVTIMTNANEHKVIKLKILNCQFYTRLQLQNLQHSMLCFKLSITQCSTQLAKAMNRTEQNRTELTLPNCLANQSIQTSSKQNRTAQPEAEPSTLEMKQQAAPLLSVNTLPTTL